MNGKSSNPIGWVLGLAMVGELHLELPYDFTINSLVANGGKYIYGLVDSASSPYLMKWSSEGKLLHREPAPTCCGNISTGGDLVIISEIFSAELYICDTALKFIKKLALETGCAPHLNSIPYKHVYPLGDGNLLVFGKYGARGYLSMASVWDTSGKFLRDIILPEAPWDLPMPFGSSPLSCMSNGELLLAADAFSFKFYLVSLRGGGEVLKVFSPEIKGLESLPPPSEKEGKEVYAFEKWLQRECISGHPCVATKPSYPLSDTVGVLFTSQCADFTDLNMNPQIHIYDSKRGKVLWSGLAEGAILGGIKGDTLLIGKKGVAQWGKFYKAVVK